MASYKSMVAMLVATAAAKNYNILSLDSAKYAGLMQSEFLAYVERRAYYIAR